MSYYEIVKCKWVNHQLSAYDSAVAHPDDEETHRTCAGCACRMTDETYYVDDGLCAWCRTCAVAHAEIYAIETTDARGTWSHDCSSGAHYYTLEDAERRIGELETAWAILLTSPVSSLFCKNAKRSRMPQDRRKSVGRYPTTISPVCVRIRVS
jgi:hypothetical protein